MGATGITMKIAALDHFVLTVASIEATCDFYASVLGMTVIEFAVSRKALAFGSQKINLHQAGREFEPKAFRPVRGSADFCLICEGPLDDVMAHLASLGVTIEDGPVQRTGAMGPIRSVYVRDPDLNLIEIAEYI